MRVGYDVHAARDDASVAYLAGAVANPCRSEAPASNLVPFVVVCFGMASDVEMCLGPNENQ